ncbi:MAG: hypothetical protein AAF569_05225 [Pseudomonadota bacterium]
MKPIKTLVLGASVLAIGLGAMATSTPAHAANSGTSEYVNYVDLVLFGDAPTINIKNMSGNKDLSALNLQVQENEIEYIVSGRVDCKGFNVEPKGFGNAFFGPLAMGGFGNIVSSATLHHDGNMDYADEDTNVVESPQDFFSIPLNKIKNGHPATRVDPLAELEKAREAFNGSDLEFYQQDREIEIQRPISFSMTCGKAQNPGKSSSGFDTEMGTIHIKYKGDPQLLPTLNANLGQNNLPNQVDAGDQPIKITDMSFQPNMPNHVGKCPATKSIRVNFMGQGEGQIKIRVNDGGSTIYQSSAIDYNGGQGHHDFDLDVPNVSKFDLNKTFYKDLKVYVLTKDDSEQFWPSHYQIKDQEQFSYRCTPQLQEGLQGGGGGLQGYQDNDGGGNSNLGKIQPIPSKPGPGPAINGSIQSQPVDPSPAPKLKLQTNN